MKNFIMYKFVPWQSEVSFAHETQFTVIGRFWRTLCFKREHWILNMIHCFRSLCYLCFINNIFWSSSVLTSCLVKARILLFYMLSYIIVSHESTLLCLFMTKVLCLAVITSLLIITSTKRFLELPIFISYWSRDSHDLSGWLSKKQINSMLSSVCSVMDHRWR